MIILGPVGMGQTRIPHALGHVACSVGFQVRVHRPDSLLRLLRQSRVDHSRDVIMTELTTVDLLVIDDFALKSMTREEGRDVRLLFVEPRRTLGLGYRSIWTNKINACPQNSATGC